MITKIPLSVLRKCFDFNSYDPDYNSSKYINKNGGETLKEILRILFPRNYNDGKFHWRNTRISKLDIDCNVAWKAMMSSPSDLKPEMLKWKKFFSCSEDLCGFNGFIGGFFEGLEYNGDTLTWQSINNTTHFIVVVSFNGSSSRGGSVFSGKGYVGG